MSRVALFDWSAGGHRPIYIRRFVEALRPSADVLLALPQATLDAVSELEVETFSLGDERPTLGGRLHRRSVLAEEVRLLRHVTSLADRTVHLYADHALFHLTATRKSFSGEVSLVVFMPRAHYSAVYNTRLTPRDRPIAYAKDHAIRRWSRRDEAGAVFTFDEEAAGVWQSDGMTRARWLPEPPVADIAVDELPASRDGLVLYGHLAPRKGIDLLASALTLERTPIRLVLAGSIESEYVDELERLAAAMSSAGVDIEVRATAHSEIEGLKALGAARCAVLPYPRHPGMSRVLLEASSVGTPVVAEKFGLLGHLVRTNGLGLVVDCSDPYALREALVSVIEADRSAYMTQLANFAARFTREAFRSALLTGLDLTTQAQRD